jgi:mannose-6-phosphate isomerase-like protein (cupin superfamily)
MSIAPDPRGNQSRFEGSCEMKKGYAVVAGCIALLAGCGGASAKPTAPSSGGAAEIQGSPATAAASRPEAPAVARPAPFRTNILQAARDNDAYRRVVFTGAKTQLALMTIPSGSDIGMETHANVEQLIFIASGQGKAILNGVESAVRPGDVVVATPGTQHDVVNTGAEPLRIYTVYAPPNHIDGRVHPTKADADADTADEAFGRQVR